MPRFDFIPNDRALNPVDPIQSEQQIYSDWYRVHQFNGPYDWGQKQVVLQIIRSGKKAVAGTYQAYHKTSTKARRFFNC